MRAFITSAPAALCPGAFASSFTTARSKCLRPNSQSCHLSHRHERRCQKSVITSSQSSSSLAATSRDRAKQPAGGKGPLSANFLSVSGTLATLASLTVLLPLLALIYTNSPVSLLSINQVKVLSLARALFLIFISFTQGLLISRFDLNKFYRLKLTIIFVILLRILVTPVLSYILTLSIPINSEIIHSTVFLLSTTPMFLSPSLSSLSTHINPTLLSLLILSNHLVFPILPILFYQVTNLINSVYSYFNILSHIPIIEPPPSILKLLLTITLPFLSGVLINRSVKPRRLSAIFGLLSLPATWILSLFLLCLDCVYINLNLKTILAVILLYSSILTTMFIFARLLSRILSLKGRTKRTIILFVCTPGVMVLSGLLNYQLSSCVIIITACVSLISTLAMARAWSHVVIRTSDEVLKL